MNKTELKKLSAEELVEKYLELQNESKAAQKAQADAETREKKLTEDLTAKQEEVYALEETVKDMETTIEDLNQDRKDAESGQKIVTLGKDRYVVRTPKFKLEGKEHTYKDLREDESLLKKVLKIDGQGIVELEKN